MKNTTYAIARSMLVFIAILPISCKKDWLDKKPDKSIVVPTSLDDFDALLANDQVMNLNPGLGELSADDYYITDEIFSYLPTATERNSYTWNKEIFEGETCGDWDIAYQQVFFCNIVLDGLAALKPAASEIARFNNIKGQALFFRAYAFYTLAQLFAVPYSQTSQQEPGIPLKLISDINEQIKRGTIAETYRQLGNDLSEAVNLLPVTQEFKTRPSKPAALALLARISLENGQYEQALDLAQQCLDEQPQLLNFNALDTLDANPIGFFNPEVLFHSAMLLYTALNTPYAIIDTTLYRAYDNNDLRKSIYFTGDGYGNFVLKSSYGGSPYYPFTGMATDEVYLVKAECLARQNEVAVAMQTLNNLLRERYRAGTFLPLTAANSTEALQMILLERRKELVFRGLRWNDLRRLNTDPAFARTIHRKINGNDYSLAPNSDRYTLPIPPDELKINNLEQNPR